MKLLQSSCGRNSAVRCRFPPCAVFVALAIFVNGATLWAQSGAASSTDQQTIQKLLQRIDALESRVAKLEAERQSALPKAAPTGASSATPAPASTASSAAASPDASPQTETEAEQQAPERMDISKTLLRIRGFGDVNLHGDTGKNPTAMPPFQKRDTTSFTLGQLNLFVTSDISDKFKFLSEIVFEAGPDNIYGHTRGTYNSFGVDIERMLVQYSYNDYFNLTAGRWHTDIGYYNNAYHHSTWLQTTTERPFLYAFEDQGGILPIHTVGVSASGQIPSGKLGLHYVAEVGNGRESRDPLSQEPVQNIVDEQNHKAYNLAIFARPEAVQGLQTGFSVYRDLLNPITSAPPNGSSIQETILAAHAVYTRPSFEWLNEVLLVRHDEEGGRILQMPGFYSQISKRFGSYRPYFRYQYLNANGQDKIFPDVGHREGPSVGIRYDASEFVALKFQYDYNRVRSPLLDQSAHGLTTQLAFTF